MNRYEVESRVNQIVNEVARDNNLENDFHGDYYCEEILDLMKKAERKNKDCFFDDIKMILEDIAEEVE